MRSMTRSRWVFVLCWITYVSAYMGRINYSIVMEKLGTFLAVGTDQLGVIGSAYFMTYAVGQLLNGFLGDRVSPFKFIGVALVGTASMNFAISCSSSYGLILLLWCLNGYFQSMFWGPLMRLLSQNFPAEKRSAVSTGMATAIIAGYAIVWNGLGSVLLDSSWRAYFIIPAVASTGVIVLWLVSSRISRMAPASGQILATDRPPLSLRGIWQNIIEHRLWVFALICICMGLVKESISMWTPMIVTGVLGLDVRQSPLYLLTFPLVNLLGIFFSGWLVKRNKDNIRKTLLLLFSCVVGCALLLLVSKLSPMAVIVFLSSLSALMYGSQNILLGVVPMTLTDSNMVATIVGILDFSSYFGAAVSSILMSRILSGTSGMTAIVLVWLFFSVLAGLLCSTIRVAPQKIRGKTAYESS